MTRWTTPYNNILKKQCIDKTMRKGMNRGWRGEFVYVLVLVCELWVYERQCNGEKKLCVAYMHEVKFKWTWRSNDDWWYRWWFILVSFLGVSLLLLLLLALTWVDRQTLDRTSSKRALVYPYPSLNVNRFLFRSSFRVSHLHGRL